MFDPPMRIGELADHIGVSTDTIRFYEKSGLLPKPSRQRDNNYREYGEADAEHLRLLIDLRRLDIPLDDAARIAGWCHAGHCGETTAELPRLLAERRASITVRIEGLQELDARLAELERHLARERRSLSVVGVGGGPCCESASAITDVAEGGCACCAPSGVASPGA
jgi:DNA-binding transcriptional MerR regulator